jgi:hypothetical protein
MILAIQLAFGRVGVGRAEAVGLLLEFKNHPEYTKGAQVSTLILAARYGRKDLQGDPLLMEAKARVRSMPKGLREAFGSEEDEQVAEVLFQDLLVGPIKDRYGELWRTR